MSDRPVCALHCGCIPGDNGSITVYGANSVGDAKRIAAIEGFSTRLAFPEAIAVDSAENIYVLASGINLVTEVLACWASGSDKQPIRTRRLVSKLPETDEDDPWILPPTFSIGEGARDVLVFSAGSHGDAPPSQIVSGPLTGINGYGIAVGPAGP